MIQKSFHSCVISEVFHHWQGTSPTAILIHTSLFVRFLVLFDNVCLDCFYGPNLPVCVCIPDAPCVEYLPTFIYPQNGPNVGKYSIHGASGHR